MQIKSLQREGGFVFTLSKSYVAISSIAFFCFRNLHDKYQFKVNIALLTVLQVKVAHRKGRRVSFLQKHQPVIQD